MPAARRDHQRHATPTAIGEPPPRWWAEVAGDVQLGGRSLTVRFYQFDDDLKPRPAALRRL